jgi:hypothetical protein
MLIYGGNTTKGLRSDMLKLDLKTFLWTVLLVEGDHPGPRESMGFVQTRNHCYVFGGNVGAGETDQVTNDFYRLTVAGFKVRSSQMSVEGRKPSPRASNSLNVFDDTRLIVFGGEGPKACLNDIWLYDIPSSTWHEIIPDSQIAPRMAHLAFCNQGKLYIFGGFDGSEIKHDLCMLTIEETMSIGQPPSASPSCSQCGHEPHTCSFLLKFPELGYPRMNFYARCQLSSALLSQVCMQYTNPILNLVTVPLSLGQSSLSVSCDDFVSLNVHGRLLKFVSEELDVASDEEEDGLKIKLTKKKRKGNIPALRLNLDQGLDPNEVARIVGGTADKNLLGPLLAMSDTLLVVSRTSEHLTVALLAKGPVYVPCYFVVYDSDCRPLFPAPSVFHANMSNILQHTHLTLSELTAQQGLNFYIHTPVFQADDCDIYCAETRLTDYLAKVFYKAPAPIQFFVQGKAVMPSFMHNVLKERRAKVQKEPFKATFKWSEAKAEEYAYRQNLLVSYKTQPRVIGVKTPRAESCLVRWKMPRPN